MVKNGTTPSTIIVLMDGSPSAQAAAAIAIQVARKSHLMAIRGLNVIDEALVFDTYASYRGELAHAGTPESRTELVEWFQEQGQLALDWLEGRCLMAGVLVTTELLLGSITDIVYKQEDQATLLALGRRGRKYAADSGALGHNFQTIAHHVQTPFLVGGGNQGPIRRILLVYETGKHGQLSLSWVKRLQQELSVNVTSLVFGKNGNDPERLQAELADYGLAGNCLISNTDRSAENIVETASDCQVDLIVMGGYRHNKLVTTFVGSTLEKVLKATPLPILVT